MRVYHMSLTLKPEDAIVPDFGNNASLCEPFVQALERSTDCFAAMVYQGKYLYSLFLHSKFYMEWVDYSKWATEGAFEYIRRKEFPDKAGRLECNYFYDNLEDIKKLFEYDWSNDKEDAENVHIYAIELDDEQPQKYDMNIYDMAYEAMNDRQDIEYVLECARRYFSEEKTENPVLEIVSKKPAKIAENMEKLHDELMKKCFGENLSTD